MTALIVFAAIGLLIAAVLGLDWFLAGRRGSRALAAARRGDPQSNTDVDLAVVQTNAQSYRAGG